MLRKRESWNTEMLLLILTTIILSLGAIYYWLKKCYKYWKIQNVPYITPDSLMFGNLKDLMLGKLSLTEMVKKHYNELAPHQFGGIYSFQNPILILRDPKLVKTILTKDHLYFFDRGFYLMVKDESLTHNLFNLMGDDWKILRNKLSPIFSLAKIKSTFPIVQEYVKELLLVMDECTFEQDTLDMKDLLARFFIDVVGSCFFGIQSNSLHQPDCEFRKMGLKTFHMDWKLTIRSVLYAFNPQLTNNLGIKSINKDVEHFFRNLIEQTVKYRLQFGIVRNDFLNQLINLIKDGKPNNNTDNFQLEQTDIEFMAAQCFLFFLAGYETSSNASSFALLEIAKDPMVQNQLQIEIDKIWNKYKGNISYNSILELTYMDQVIAETMRIYPAIPILMRTCTENYVMPNSNFVVPKGTVVYIPIYGLHHDPQYFPSPEKFDPERFSDQNKELIPQGVYLPFGDGPKICIGMRFGLMELKLVLFQLLRQYTFSVSSKMELPVKIKKRTVLTCCDGGIWLTYVKRNISNEE